MTRPIETQLGGATNPGAWSLSLPSGDAGNATLALDGALGGVFECVAATSSPAGTVEGKTAAGVWTQIESYQYTSGTYTRRAAGVTVTLATGDLLFVPGPGFTHVRFKRGSGTSMTWTARTLEGLADILLIRQLASGVSVTGTITSLPQKRWVDVTFTIDNANALDAGDVGVAGELIAACVRANDALGYLTDVVLVDGDDNTAAGMNLFFFSNNVTLGTIDAAISISDADLSAYLLGVVPVASADWFDTINSKVAARVMGDTGLPMSVKPKSGTDDIYVGIQVLGSPTFTTGKFTARFAFQDAV